MTTPASLWRHADFKRLWAAQSVSSFGARITREGLPIMAVVTLQAEAPTVGLLAALANGAALIVGLALGGFVDRRRRRPVLIGADILRAVVLLSIPLAAAFQALTMVQVFAVAALVMGASALFDMADHAYLPDLIGREHLVEGNSKLAVTESVAEMGGPALAGQLFQWLTAPFAVALNAVSYLVSAAFLGAIRTPEPKPEPPAPDHWASDLTAGFRITWAQPVVRSLFLMTAAQGLFGGVFSALYTFFAFRTLGMTPALFGLAVAAGGAGALLGAGLAARVGRWLGTGPAIIVTIAAAALSACCIPLAPATVVGGTMVMVLTQITGDAFGTAALILMASLRQTLVPREALGRSAGAFRAAAGGLAVVGALGGGALGAAIGPRAAILVAGLGLLSIPIIGAFSPLRRVRSAEG